VEGKEPLLSSRRLSEEFPTDLPEEAINIVVKVKNMDGQTTLRLATVGDIYPCMLPPDVYFSS